ncbi:MAG: exodeoxyribonuclease VII small subunit [bacterium]|nr:exodeoxyribonuclease VII small subunit [bacterium]
MDFEESLKKLESLVTDLENKDIKLEDAIKKYKEALELSKSCYDTLKKAELVVKVDE